MRKRNRKILDLLIASFIHASYIGFVSGLTNMIATTHIGLKGMLIGFCVGFATSFVVILNKNKSKLTKLLYQGLLIIPTIRKV